MASEAALLKGRAGPHGARRTPRPDHPGADAEIEALLDTPFSVRPEVCCSRLLLEKGLHAIGHDPREFPRGIVHDDLRILDLDCPVAFDKASSLFVTALSSQFEIPNPDGHVASRSWLEKPATPAGRPETGLALFS